MTQKTYLQSTRIIILILFIVQFSGLTKNVITKQEFNKIKDDMTYDEVIRLIGSEPTDDNSENWSPYVPTILHFRNIDGSYASVWFSHGLVINTSSKGL